jgi:protein-L-isoaspartate(D-aspartate) O-methyltransferase
LDQLKEGGRLVIPVGSRWEQELLRVTLRKSGNRVEKLGGCRFVPLIGPGAWQE